MPCAAWKSYFVMLCSKNGSNINGVGKSEGEATEIYNIPEIKQRRISVVIIRINRSVTNRRRAQR